MLGLEGVPAAEDLRPRVLRPGAPLGAARAAFPRIEKEKARVRYRRRRLPPPALPRQAAPPAAGDRIDISEFARVELRAAKVTAAEKIAGSKKLREAAGGPRRRAAPGGGRHRGVLRARGAGRPHGGARRQPEAGEADGRGVERHGPRRPRWTARPCCARSTPRSRPARRSSSAASRSTAFHRRGARSQRRREQLLSSAFSRVLCVSAVKGSSRRALRRVPGPQKTVVYDLARRVGVADRWSGREVILFGTPAAEPHQVDGFYREGAAPEGDAFTWAKGHAELSLSFPRAAARTAIVDLAPYRGVQGADRGGLAQRHARVAPGAQRRPPPLPRAAARRGAEGRRQPAALRVRAHGVARRTRPATPTAASSRPPSTA